VLHFKIERGVEVVTNTAKVATNRVKVVTNGSEVATNEPKVTTDGLFLSFWGVLE
jgi:hypothetical protein